MTQSINSSWIEKLQSAKKAGLLQNGIVNYSKIPIVLVLLVDRKKIHYTFDDQSEMVEEYDAKTNLLLSMINRCLHACSIFVF